MTTVTRRGLARRAVPAISILLLGTLVAACDRSSGTSGANPTQNASATEVTLTITSNAIAGGKNAAEADWIANWVIPEVHRGRRRPRASTSPSKFEPSGVDDEDYKTKIALDLQAGERRRHHRHRRHLGRRVRRGRLHQAARRRGRRGHGRRVGRLGPDPGGGAGQRVVRRQALRRARRHRRPRALLQQEAVRSRPACPPTGSPTSWDEILDAGARAQGSSPASPRSSSTPAPRWARRPRCRACCRCSSAPARRSTRTASGRATPSTSATCSALPDRSTSTGLGDPVLQQEAKGRDKSFAAFAANKIGILLEGDYFWRRVVDPDKGVRADGRPRRGRRLRQDPGQTPGRRRQRPGLRLDVRRRRARAQPEHRSTRSRPGSCSQFMNSAEAHQGARWHGTARITPRDGRQQRGARRATRC